MPQRENIDSRDLLGVSSYEPKHSITMTSGCSATSVVPPDPEVMRKFTALESQINQLDQTVWAKEITAQRFESTWTKLWDDLRLKNYKVEVLSNFSFEKLSIGTPRQPQKQSAGIEIVRFDQPYQELSPNEWRKYLQKLQKEGYRLEQAEFHLAEFEVTPDGQAHSVIATELHIINSEYQQRSIVKGNLNVTYKKGSNEFGLPIPETVDATKLELLQRTGVPAFVEALTWSPSREFNKIIDPLMLYDLDGDGLSEIVLGGANRVYWNLGGGKFQAAPLLKQAPTGVQATILADFTGDGYVDLLCADQNGLLMFAGGGGDKMAALPNLPAEYGPRLRLYCTRL